MTTERLQLQIVRLIRLARLLEGSRLFTYEELVVRFRVTSRTVRRDVAALQDAGAEIVVESDDSFKGMPRARVGSLRWIDGRLAR